MLMLAVGVKVAMNTASLHMATETVRRLDAMATTSTRERRANAARIDALSERVARLEKALLEAKHAENRP